MQDNNFTFNNKEEENTMQGNNFTFNNKEEENTMQDNNTTVLKNDKEDKTMKNNNYAFIDDEDFFDSEDGNNITFAEQVESEIRNSDIPPAKKAKLLRKFEAFKNQTVNILIAGATGCGKSSTINALFDTEVAKVGTGPDPETMDIKKYEFNNMVLWDSPGLGDSVKADKRHAKNIIRKLNEKDKSGKPLIDVVLIILDGSARDIGTPINLINETIIPALGKEARKRVLVAINQADMAMKGRYWNAEENCPEKPLEDFLEQKVLSIKDRIAESTGVEITPIYYSAGYCDRFGNRAKPYNLMKLLYFIMKATPSEKRIKVFQNVNSDEDNFKKNDHDYDIWDLITEGVEKIGKFVFKAIEVARKIKPLSI